jgi:hypothetical protein
MSGLSGVTHVTCHGSCRLTPPTRTWSRSTHVSTAASETAPSSASPDLFSTPGCASLGILAAHHPLASQRWWPNLLQIDRAGGGLTRARNAQKALNILVRHEVQVQRPLQILELLLEALPLLVDRGDEASAPVRVDAGLVGWVSNGDLHRLWMNGCHRLRSRWRSLLVISLPLTPHENYSP